MYKRTMTGGFTLVELIVVLALIGIFSSAIVVSFVGREDSFVLKAKSQELADAIQFAAGQSRLTDRPWRVLFNDAFTEFSVEQQTTSGDFDRPPGLAGSIRRLGNGITIGPISVEGNPLTPKPTSLLFSSQDSRFHGQVIMQSAEGRTATIEIMEGTNQVVIHE